jgi:hypothetical protein
VCLLTPHEGGTLGVFGRVIFFPTIQGRNHEHHPAAPSQSKARSRADDDDLRRPQTQDPPVRRPSRASRRRAPTARHALRRPGRDAWAQLRSLRRAFLRRAVGRRRAQSVQHPLEREGERLRARRLGDHDPDRRRAVQDDGRRAWEGSQVPAPRHLRRRRRHAFGHARLRAPDRGGNTDRRCTSWRRLAARRLLYRRDDRVPERRDDQPLRLLGEPDRGAGRGPGAAGRDAAARRSHVSHGGPRIRLPRRTAAPAT